MAQMPPHTPDNGDDLWARHHAQWRDPAQVIGFWAEAAALDRRLLRYQVQGAWWETLASIGGTLLVSREYEHLLMALRVDEDQPHVTYMRIPHPSGIAFDPVRGVVHVACTRNPNQVLDLKPITGVMPRQDMPYTEPLPERPLTPVRSRFFPGCLYMHDLAMVNGVLHANAVGQNAVVRLHEDGSHQRVWWPLCIEQDGQPVFGQNHIQLNSIAAGDDLAGSYFSASADRISARRPGHKHFPVDGRGVIFSGDSRTPVAWGLTRPHSARLHQGRLWVDNSGYGELGVIVDGRLEVAARLPGWTRGLCLQGAIALIGTSRVIPRFRQYAPGLEVDGSICGLHAVELSSGKVLGSLTWPEGNQIFAVEMVPGDFAGGLLFSAHGRRAHRRERKLLYSYRTDDR